MGLIFLAGLAVGSFLNVLIDRLPKGENIVWGRSRCDYCKKTLRWYELVPIASWVFQGGRCRRCHRRLRLQYPLVEFATGVAYVGTYVAVSGFGARFFAWLVIVSAGIVITVTDFRHRIIPDSMLVVSGVAAIFLQSAHRSHIPMVLISGAGAAAFFYLLYKLTRGKGMGFGDVKLAGVLGVLLGYPWIIIGVYAAFLTGATYGVILMILGEAGMKSRVAFGPFLLLGGIISLVWGMPILRFMGLI